MSSDVRSFDAAVIGGGLLGCFTARNLRRWKLSVALLEAREDVCTGITRANTAIVYPGYDHKPGTLKANMTVQANARFPQLCGELGVAFSRCGSLMLSFGPNADAVLRRKLEQGLQSGVPELRLLTGTEAKALEPSLSDGVTSALYAPTAGTVNPWELGIAAYENALANGAEVFLNTAVTGIQQTEDGSFLLQTSRGEFACRAVINCAGLAAARVQELLAPSPVRIVPDGADYLVVDKAAPGMPQHILQAEPEDGGKGFTAVPTVEGSLLLGPSEREAGTAFATTEEGLAFVRNGAARILPQLDLDFTIRSFGAVRPNPRTESGESIGSFVIDTPLPGFWSMIGIKTPGLTCADELGQMIAEQAAALLGAAENEAFNPHREGIRKLRDLSPEQRAEAVRRNPDCGEIVCCCEEISKAEALEAIRRGAVTIDGIKRRTGAGLGRCQGSRCQARLAELLAAELGVPVASVTKDGPGSELLGGAHGTL